MIGIRIRHRSYFGIVIAASAWLILSVACSTPSGPRRNVAADGRLPRHLIFLVHGIGGDATTFGSMHDALMAQLPQTNSGEAVKFRYDVRYFNYETRDNDKGVSDFALELGEAIHQAFMEEGGARDDDRFSLIGHSQGGLIGLYWLRRAAAGDPSYHAEYLPKIDAYITLGTPFWGASAARLGKGYKASFLSRYWDVLSALGAQQLREMSFGSGQISSYFQQGVQQSLERALQEKKYSIRPLQFGGSAFTFEHFSALDVGRTAYEDDAVVLIPSSHYDFLYADLTKNGYRSLESNDVSVFQETHFAPHHIVKAVHLSLGSEIKSLQGIAAVPKQCVRDPDCDHPTYRYVLAHLKGKPVKVDENLLSKMTAYVIQIEVHTPAGDPVPVNKIKLIQRGLSPNVVVRDFFGVHRASDFVPDDDPDCRRFFLSGTATGAFIKPERRKNGVAFADRRVQIEIEAPGYKTRLIEAKVRPTYTTFIDVNLERVSVQ